MARLQRIGSAVGALPRRTRFSLIPPTLTLAVARVRQTWRLLLVTQIGVLAAVTLMCMIPLFSQVATSAGLRLALTGQANAGGGPGFSPFGGRGNASLTQEQVQVAVASPTSGLIAQASQRVDQIMRGHLGPYLAGPAQFSLATQPFPLLPTAQQANPNGASADMMLVGADIGQASQHSRTVRGALPLAKSDDLEVALSPETATALHVTVGSDLQLALAAPAPPGQQPTTTHTVTLHVVAVFEPSDVDTFWGGQDFAPQTYGPNGLYHAMVSTDTLLAVLPPLLSSSQSDANSNPYKGYLANAFNLTWVYNLDLSHLNANDLGSLNDQVSAARAAIFNLAGDIPGIQDANVFGALDVISEYRTRVIAVMVPITILTLQVIGLVLLFVQLMANILAERQAEAIAILHSRGAHRRQILGALVVQGLGISLLAGIAGPLLAIPLVRVLAQQLLPPSSQSALDTIGGAPLPVVQSILVFAIIGAVGAMVALIFALLRAANMNVLALRRETARERGKSFWQRLNLDLVFVVLAGVAYGLYSLALASLGPGARTGLSALAIVWPIFLLIAGALLFLRVFPLLLRFGSWLAGRGGGASSTLALSQLARTPRQSTRMILLLALTTAFAIFTLIFTASQAQRLADVTSFRVGADFSGTLSPAEVGTMSAADQSTTYRNIPGVRSATGGYDTSAALRTERGGGQVQILAVDTASYADTALWSSTESSQSLPSLMGQLATPSLGDLDAVPAVVDDAMATMFQVHVGDKFSVSPPGYTNGAEMRFVVEAVIHHIPGVYDSPELDFQSGMLVDYAAYAKVYQTDLSAAPPAPNTIWLMTDDDTQALANVREALGKGNLAVTSLLDRRQMLSDMRGDPLQLNLVGTLLVGTATALALALLGGWIASWLSARSRLTNFAVLRALGTTPRQVLQVLLWEYGVVYVSALGLGVLLGWLLSSAALPSMVFANALEQNSPFDVPPTRMVMPAGELGLAIGGLAVLCAAAIGVMTLVLSRSSLGATLRLNQD